MTSKHVRVLRPAFSSPLKVVAVSTRSTTADKDSSIQLYGDWIGAVGPTWSGREGDRRRCSGNGIEGIVVQSTFSEDKEDVFSACNNNVTLTTHCLTTWLRKINDKT